MPIWALASGAASACNHSTNVLVCQVWFVMGPEILNLKARPERFCVRQLVAVSAKASSQRVEGDQLDPCLFNVTEDSGLGEQGQFRLPLAAVGTECQGGIVVARMAHQFTDASREDLQEVQEMVQGQGLRAVERADEAVGVGEPTRPEKGAVGDYHTSHQVVGEALEEGEGANCLSKVGRGRERNAKGQVEASGQVRIDLKERREEVDKVMAVEMVRPLAGQGSESLYLGGQLGQELCRGDRSGLSPQGMLIEEEAVLIHQAGDVCGRQ